MEKEGQSGDYDRSTKFSVSIKNQLVSIKLFFVSFTEP